MPTAWWPNTLKTQSLTYNVHNWHITSKRTNPNAHIRRSDQMKWLNERKWAYARSEGAIFGKVPLNLEYKHEK